MKNGRRMMSILLVGSLLLHSAPALLRANAAEQQTTGENAPQDSPQEQTTGENAPQDTPQPKTGLAAFEVEGASEVDFSDVWMDQYFYDAVGRMCALEIVAGTSSTTFSPEKSLSFAEACTLATRVYRRYYGLAESEQQGEFWYTAAMQQAQELGLLAEPVENPNAAISRRQAVLLLGAVLPEGELAPRRTVEGIAGQSRLAADYPQLLRLYRAGIVGGVDAYGRLNGAGEISRAEFVTLLDRLLRPESRLSAAQQNLQGTAAFALENTQTALPYADVDGQSWYASDLLLLANLGIPPALQGSFAPQTQLTVGEAVWWTMRLYARYHGGIEPAEQRIAWQAAAEQGLLDGAWTDPAALISREQLIALLSKLMPEQVTAQNRIRGIAGIDAQSAYYQAAYDFCAAGIVGGVGNAHQIDGGAPVARAELCTMLARMIDPARRLTYLKDLSAVEQAVRQTIAGFLGDWSVYVADMDSGVSFSVNNKRMPSASLIKLYIAGTVLDGISRGTLSDSAYVRQNLHSMITVSSNTAWTIFARMIGGGNYNIGMDRVTQWAVQNGYPNSGNIREAYTTAEDTGRFLEDVLRGQIVNEQSSAYMLSLLLAQQHRSKIPAGVPSGVQTANKTGDLYKVNHDAAIVYAPYGTYVVVIMTEYGAAMGLHSNIVRLSSVIYREMERAA